MSAAVGIAIFFIILALVLGGVAIIERHENNAREGAEEWRDRMNGNYK